MILGDIITILAKFSPLYEQQQIAKCDWESPVFIVLSYCTPRWWIAFNGGYDEKCHNYDDWFFSELLNLLTNSNARPIRRLPLISENLCLLNWNSAILTESQLQSDPSNFQRAKRGVLTFTIRQNEKSLHLGEGQTRLIKPNGSIRSHGVGGEWMEKTLTRIVGVCGLIVVYYRHETPPDNRRETHLLFTS